MSKIVVTQNHSRHLIEDEKNIYILPTLWTQEEYNAVAQKITSEFSEALVVGSGRLMDFGKWLSRDIDVVLAPSVLTTDSAFTDSVAFRDRKFDVHYKKVSNEFEVSLDYLDMDSELNKLGWADVFASPIMRETSFEDFSVDSEIKAMRMVNQLPSKFQEGMEHWAV
ncbi:MAG: hypothetical protein ACTSPB_21955, partial [Candidatus Thorarchaeota archaeon]